MLLFADFTLHMETGGEEKNMSIAQRAKQGLILTTGVIGLCTSSLLLARPGMMTTSSAGSMTMRSGLGMPTCDPANIEITESGDLNNLDPGLVCSGSGGTSGHGYGRMHDLSGIDAGGNDIALQCVKWGIKNCLEETDVVVNIYVDDDGDPSNGMIPIGNESNTMTAGQDYYLVTTFDPPLVLSGGFIYVELSTPSNPNQNAYDIASNAGGQNSPSWLSTEDNACGVNGIVDIANIGYPNNSWVESIEVAIATPADPCDDPLPNCPTDITGSEGVPDGIVNVDDILKVIEQFNSSGDGTFRPQADCAPLPNGDCLVNVDDLLEVIGTYGQECVEPEPELSMNEFRTNHSGVDTNEYIEVFGTPGASLDGYAWIVIGDGSGESPLGHLESVIRLDGQSLDSNGIYSQIIENFFENNDPVTHVLVSGLSDVGDVSETTVDLDTNDDGVLDVTPWEAVIDCAALIGAGSSNVVYCDVTIGPDGDFTAVGGYRCPDGIGSWVMAPFQLGCQDTPGALNPCDAADDSDGDGVPDCADNCIDTPNPDQADCDDDGEGDACDTVTDCNSNNIPDVCETDCNLNGVPDDCDIANETSADCNANGIPDECDPDCNGNGSPDSCDIENGDSQDSDGNGIPDECESPVLVINEILADPSNIDLDGDANGDGVNSFSDDEFVEIVNMTGEDLYLGGATLSDGFGVRHTFPTSTPTLSTGCAIVVFGGGEPAGNFGGAVVQTASEGALGLNNSGDDVTLTAADGTILATASYGSDGGNNQSLNKNPDIYGEVFALHSELSTDGNLFSPGETVDGLSFGGSDCGSGGGNDADSDGVPDDFDNCDLPNPDQADCDGNGIGDVCDIADNTYSDCDGNGVPDVCDPDCNENNVADACDITDGTSQDTNANGIPDECESGLTGCYDWADGGTVMGFFGDNVIFENVPDPLGGSGFALKMTEAPLQGTPQGYVGWVTGLTDGDTIDVSMLGLGDGTTTSKMRLWGHYTATGGDITSYAGSASGPGNYSDSTTAWTELTHQWVFDSDGGARDGLVIEARIYSYANADPSGYVTDISVSVNTSGSGAAISFPGTSCDITPPADADGDGVADDVDNCDLYNEDQADCDGNGIGDVCDLADNTYSDCDGNGVPDLCDTDCNDNGVPDTCDITDGTSQDKNGNGVPDECETGDGNGFYNWSNGGTVLGSYGDNVTFENVSDPLGGDDRCLKITEDPLQGTPQGYVAWVTGLTDGDTVDVSMFGLGDGDTTSKIRLWAHYTVVDDITSYAGSASGPGNYSDSATAWTELTHQWTFDSDSGARDGLVIEARIYSYTGADPSCYAKDLSVSTSGATATISFPEGP